MADAPREPGSSGREPNLELPSLRLGRRRKKAVTEPSDAENEPLAAPPAPPAPEPSALGPAAPPAPPAPPTPEPVLEDTAPVAAEERIPPPPVMDDATTAMAPQPQPQPQPAALDEDTEPEATVLAPRRRTGRRAMRLPRIPAGLAAPLVGVVCGLAAVGLAALAADGCSTVRGVGGCGSFGLVALVAILAIEVLLGAALLRLAGLRDTTSTSFLGVGLVAVLAMLFFLDEIDSPWMLLVIPVLSAAAFWLSWWTTAHFVDEAVD